MLSFPQFDFELPKGLIAQYPSEKRGESRLFLFDRAKKIFQHHHFYDLPQLLHPSDLLVVNNTKVIPARLWGELSQNGREVELLLLRNLGKEKWRCLTKPAKYLKPGVQLYFGKELKGKVTACGEQGLREIQFESPGGGASILEFAREKGAMPLPPYIRRQAEVLDKERYQTVFAHKEGAAAAPTAGLHFSNELLLQLKEKGINTAFVTLHVGLGTFRPLTHKEWENGKLHVEEYDIPEETEVKIDSAMQNKGRIIAVGTTSVRALETAVLKQFPIKAIKGETDLFIYPPYKFKVVNGLITNFHFPNSSLLWLVSAFAGEKNLRRCYEEAIKNKYRFYSYGDAMFIV